MLVLDSGGVSALARRTRRSRALVAALLAEGLLPATVPTVVAVEALRGHAARDAPTNQFLKTCLLEPDVPLRLARRAAELRRLGGRGSAVDALVVALAEPGGTVLTGDRADLEALAAHADRVAIEVV